MSEFEYSLFSSELTDAEAEKIARMSEVLMRDLHDMATKGEVVMSIEMIFTF